MTNWTHRELVGWRRAWGWLAVAAAVATVLCTIVVLLNPDAYEGTAVAGVALGVLGASSCVSAACWSHFGQRAKALREGK